MKLNAVSITFFMLKGSHLWKVCDSHKLSSNRAEREWTP